MTEEEEHPCHIWRIVWGVALFIGAGIVLINQVQAHGVFEEAHGNRKCTAMWCEDVVPWIVVVEAKGEAYGYEMRTENGCYLAGYVASREGAEKVACYEDEKSAEKDFPALQIVGEGQLGGID